MDVIGYMHPTIVITCALEIGDVHCYNVSATLTLGPGSFHYNNYQLQSSFVGTTLVSIRTRHNALHKVL